MGKRLATLSIFMKNRKDVEKVNKIISGFSEMVVSRMGIPYKKKGIAIIVLILDGTTDEIGALSGKLGNLKEIMVKTAMPKI
ncbi:MAG: CopG family transcriptional regulator [Fusobacteriia bacterium 4572_132]|nr:MAG: CopG family transcriptional regulator [Fusobacteriia bacterium 4572_132]